MSDKPVLIMLCGAPGAGKTTFYESKLKSVFPTMLKASSSPLEQAEIDQERRRLQRKGNPLSTSMSLRNSELSAAHRQRVSRSRLSTLGRKIRT
jgi:predicted kinase